MSPFSDDCPLVLSGSGAQNERQLQCPSCRDGIKNQGEDGVDCGGPCLDRCPFEEPSGINFFLIFIILLLILLIIFIIYIIYRYVIFFFCKDKEERKDKEGNVKPLRGGSRKKRIQTLLKNKGSEN